RRCLKDQRAGQADPPRPSDQPAYHHHAPHLPDRADFDRAGLDGVGVLGLSARSPAGPAAACGLGTRSGAGRYRTEPGTVALSLRNQWRQPGLEAAAGLRRRAQGVHPVSGGYRPGRASAAIRDRPGRRRPTGQLPLPLALLHRRPPFRSRRAAPGCGPWRHGASRTHRWPGTQAVNVNTADTPNSEGSTPLPKVAPESLELRARPRRVTRLNPRMLAVLAGGLATAVLAALLWSLQPQRRQDNSPGELYNIERITRSEALEQLPSAYSQVPP